MQRRASQIFVLTIIITIVVIFSHVSLGINPKVNCSVTSKEGTADLMCKISSDEDVIQVTWQKRAGNSYETLVTNSKRYGVKISHSYENRLSVLPTTDPGTSSIALSQLEKEDDACFTAIFNIYPSGALRGNVCLPKLPGVMEVICKSPADFSVTLDPPQIKTQHSEPNGTIIQRGRWLHGTISPVCNFQLRRKARTKRNAQDVPAEKNLECTIGRIVISSVLPVVFILVSTIAVCCFLKRKQLNFPKKDDKVEEGFSTPIPVKKPQTSKNTGTPGTEIKQRKGSALKENKENVRQNSLDSSYTLINTDDEVTNATPRSVTKQRNSSSQKKKNKSVKQLCY